MNLGDVHINRDGTIRHNGDPIGFVSKVTEERLWRAEVGTPVARPDVDWPPYAVVYAHTRREAVLSVIAPLEVTT
jgi:hypothetical protein